MNEPVEGLEMAETKELVLDAYRTNCPHGTLTACAWEPLPKSKIWTDPQDLDSSSTRVEENFTVVDL